MARDGSRGMPSSEASFPLIVRTKVSSPRLGGIFLPRPRLLDLMATATSHSLTLVCAPAGYGKTSLLVEWVTSLALSDRDPVPRVCWLSLDEGENDPHSFLCYLIASMGLDEQQIWSATAHIASSYPRPAFQAVMGMLSNDLLAHGGTFVFALDDYQFISNPIIHESMAYFVDHLPSNVHVVIAARSDPPMPLARLRARNQLLEIRAKDLEFTLAETEDLINHGMGLGIAPEDVGRLAERTEGWIAGLQMAALAIRNHKDSSSFLKEFSGSNHYILDYLLAEVLESQPQDIQDFLLQTSILGNLNGELCDVVTGGLAASHGTSSQDVLEYLDRENMFVVPLDAERSWYRYHHLFADLLRARVPRVFPEEVSALHVRAAEWFEQRKRTTEAIEHFLAARAYDSACRLIEAQVEQLVGRTDMFQLLGWIHGLPGALALRPWFCIAEAWFALFQDDVPRIEPLLQAAERNIRGGEPADLLNAWRGHIACLRGFRADVQGDIRGAIEMATMALRYLPPADTANRNFARYMLGRAYLLDGDLAQAEQTLNENVRECIETEGTNIIAGTLAAIWRLYRAEGRLRECMRILQEGWSYVETRDPRRVSAAGTGLAGQGYILLEWNKLSDAERVARRALELSERWMHPTSICNCYCLLVRIYLAQQNLPAAREALRCGEEAVRGRKPFVEAESELNAVRVRYWLAVGEHGAASRWAAQRRADSASGPAVTFTREQDQISLARVALAEGNWEAGIRALEQLGTSAESGERFGDLIEILILQALALQGRGDMLLARSILQKSLTLAEPEGYVRTFAEEGEPMRKLLENYMRSSSGLPSAYAERLLSAMRESRPTAAIGERTEEPLEPLTARELDVLRLLVEGRSNRQISQALILSEGTIKFHVHNVLQKLGVHSRSEAIARAIRDKLS